MTVIIGTAAGAIAPSPPPQRDPATVFEAQKQELREHLRRARPESSEVLLAGQRLAALYSAGANLQEEPPARPTVGKKGKQDQRQEAFQGWVKRCFALGAAQCQKYLRMAQALSLTEVVGMTLGIESLFQIAIADLRLRPALFVLGDGEQLSSGALAEGRRAGLRVLQRSGDYDQAVMATVDAARRRAQRQDQEHARTQVAHSRDPLVQLEQTLARVRGQIERLLEAEGAAGDPRRSARLQEQLGALQALCARLVLRLAAVAPDASSGGASGWGGAPLGAPSAGGTALGEPSVEAAGTSARGELLAQPAEATARMEPAARSTGGVSSLASPSAEEPTAAAASGEEPAPLRAAPSPAPSFRSAPPASLVDPAATGSTAQPSDELALLAQRGGSCLPVADWILGMSPRHREALCALLAGALLGTCPRFQVSQVLNERLPLWEEEDPPALPYQRWRNALKRDESWAQTALRTLAAADPTQLLMALPRLLERLDDSVAEASGLLAAAAELRVLAARYGATVVWMRAIPEAAKETGC